MCNQPSETAHYHFKWNQSREQSSTNGTRLALHFRVYPIRVAVLIGLNNSLQSGCVVDGCVMDVYAFRLLSICFPPARAKSSLPECLHNTVEGFSIHFRSEQLFHQFERTRSSPEEIEKVRFNDIEGASGASNNKCRVKVQLKLQLKTRKRDSC